MIKKIGLAATLAVMFSFQGCGGGGETTSGGVSQTSVDTITTGKTNVTNETVDNKKEIVNNAASVQNTAPVKRQEEVPSVSKTYYIVSQKRTAYGDYNETTTYTLDETSPYIAYTKMTNTKGDILEKKYDFNQTSKTLNIYVKNIIDEWELTQKAEFEKAKAKNIVDFKNGNNSYMINTFDPIQQFYNMRVVKNIKDIEKGLFNVYTYKYDANGTIESITEGYLDSLTDTNMTVVKEDVLAKNIVEVQVEPNFSDDNMSLTYGNTKYTFVKGE
jgi:hypothetical protein